VTKEAMTEPGKEDLREMLWRASETGDIDIASDVLRRDVDVDVSNVRGTTALMRAAASGHREMVSFLLDHGADPNRSRNDGFTALLLAAFFGHTQIVRILIERGADSEATTRFGTSAQMWAAARTFKEVVDYLQKREHSSQITIPKQLARKANVDRLAVMSAVATSATGSEEYAKTDAEPVVETPSAPMKSAEQIYVEPNFVWRIPALNRIGTILACSLVALLLGGGTLARFRLRQKAPTSSGSTDIQRVVPDIQSVVREERVTVTNAASHDSALPERVPPSHNAVDNPLLLQSKIKSITRKSRLPQIAVNPSNGSETPEQTASAELKPKEVESQPARPVTPSELGPITNVAVSKGRRSNSTLLLPQPNNIQLIGPSKGSSKSGKVIAWP
jgi:hypothetical protein